MNDRFKHMCVRRNNRKVMWKGGLDGFKATRYLPITVLPVSLQVGLLPQKPSCLRTLEDKAAGRKTGGNRMALDPHKSWFVHKWGAMLSFELPTGLSAH